MNVNRSFSHDSNWTCYDDLIATYPIWQQRSIGSKLVREGIEILAKIKQSNQTTSLDDFKDNTLPRLELDNKSWNHLMKPMDTTELRKLQRQIQTKLNIVSDEIYKRTV